MYKCNTCSTIKPLSDFRKNTQTKTGHDYKCKLCVSIDYNNSPKKKELARKRHLKHKYNIDVNLYDKMYKSQNGECAICHIKSDNIMSVDHCHNTGDIRGLLCSNCNNGLGHFKDNIDILKKAIDYLG
jgi:hypothetical protein